MKYQDFTISMEPVSLDALAKLIRGADLPLEMVKAELLNLACEIEARLQHFAHDRAATPSDEDWLS